MVLDEPRDRIYVLTRFDNSISIVDTESRSLSIPLYPEAAASFGLRAPSAPGTYWIALDADWGSGGTTQVFVIDVRA